MAFESFDPAEEAAWQHSLSPTAHTDRITQRKRDFLAGVAWSERNSRLAVAVRRLQLEGYGLIGRLSPDGVCQWRVEPIAEKKGENANETREMPDFGRWFSDPIAALVEFSVSK